MDCSKKVSFEELRAKLLNISQNSPKLRTSKRRESILKTLYEIDKHLTPEEVYYEVKSRYEPEIGLATVYRSLVLLEEFDLIRSVDIQDGTKRYEINCDLEHDHIVCTECGKIDEFYSPEVDVLLQNIAAEKGYTQSSRSIRVFGICEKCMAKRSV